jgi:hypothetical protein
MEKKSPIHPVPVLAFMAGSRVKFSCNFTFTFAGRDSNWYVYNNEVGLPTSTVYRFSPFVLFR